MRGRTAEPSCRALIVTLGLFMALQIADIVATNRGLTIPVLRRMGRTDLTVHGFRSSFADWVSEQTGFPSEVREMVLAHQVGDKVEAAYRRGDLLAKRRQLAEAWARFWPRR
jgi:integrase